MSLDLPIDSGLSQARDAIALQTELAVGDLAIRQADRESLRWLAGEVASLTVGPIEDEKRDLWRRHNALGRTRPVFFAIPRTAGTRSSDGIIRTVNLGPL